MPSVPLGIAAPFAMAALAAVEQREVDLQTQLAHSMGAVLVGSLIAMLYVSFSWPSWVPFPLIFRTPPSLSGAVWMQVFLYWQLYPKDTLRMKFMVGLLYLFSYAWC